MKKFSLYFSIILIALCGCTKTTTQSDKNNKGCDDSQICDTDNHADMSAYEGFIDEDHQFIKTDMSDFLLKLDANATAVYYFGYSTCPWCVEAVPILNEVAKEQNMPIYYIDKKAETSSEEESKKIEARLGDKLEADDEGNPHLYVPYVVAIRDGKVCAYHTGTVDAHDAHERKMTEAEKSELKQIYEDLFAAIAD